jgi:3-oxoacyl-[acyl-carrier protein] reductase
VRAARPANDPVERGVAMSEPVVLVTGGSRGIGRAVCVAFGALGYEVVAVGRDQGALAKTESLVRAAGGKEASAVCDVRDFESISRTADWVLARYRSVDVLVNNAGGGSPGRPLTADELPDADWLDTLNLNLTSSFRFCRALLPSMKERRSGAIVLVTSIAARQASHLSGVAYTAAKSALVGMNRHLAREFGPFGIRVNAVAPGIIASERVAAKFDSYPDSERKALLGRIPLGRIGRVEEIASVVTFLASPGAAYVHGAIIDVNGGLYMP